MTTTSTTAPTRPTDLRAPGAIAQLLEWRRHRHGDLRMELPDGDESGSGDDAAAGDAAGQSGAGDASGSSGTDDKGQGASGQQSAAGEPKDGDVKSLPEWAQKALADARADAGKARTTAKQTAADEARQQLTQDIAKALGLAKDEKPDPAKLAEQVAAAQKQARDAATQLAVFRGSAKHGADPDALLDSRKFVESLNDLDPTSTGFDSKVAAAIKTAVDGNPKLKAGQASAGSSSVDHAGGTGEKRERTPLSLDQAVAGHYGTATR